MKELNRNTAQITKHYPERILQFGGGNFLRGFVDWIVDVYNAKTGSELGILVIKPTSGGNYAEWKQQDGLYHVLTKGIREGGIVNEQTLVSCVQRIVHPYNAFDDFIKSAEQRDIRYIISNTTESGLRVSPEDKRTDRPPTEFPAKLTLWLYHRFLTFDGNKNAGCIFLPTELVENNGGLLKQCILDYAAHWGLEDAFVTWMHDAHTFCNTLVDRIVPGIGADDLESAWQQLGFHDIMATQGEPYHLWAIEAPQYVRTELPLDAVGLNVVYTDDLTPFRTQKVRILNGAHTIMVPVGILSGVRTVRELIEHPLLGKYVRDVISQEIIPTLHMPEAGLRKFASDVLDRFSNPFIEHRLMSIALNSISKFRARVIPSLLEYLHINNTVPKRIALSLAALIRFYHGEWNNTSIPLKDEPEVIAFFSDAWRHCDGSRTSHEELVRYVLQWKKAWGADLNDVPGLSGMVAEYLIGIQDHCLEQLLEDID